MGRWEWEWGGRDGNGVGIGNWELGVVGGKWEKDGEVGWGLPSHPHFPIPLPLSHQLTFPYPTTAPTFPSTHISISYSRSHFPIHLIFPSHSHFHILLKFSHPHPLPIFHFPIKLTLFHPIPTNFLTSSSRSRFRIITLALSQPSQPAPTFPLSHPARCNPRSLDSSHPGRGPGPGSETGSA